MYNVTNKHTEVVARSDSDEVEDCEVRSDEATH